MLSEEYFQRFDTWEKRTRGWQVWPHAVELEPPYVPLPSQVSDLSVPLDDGRRHGLLGFFWAGSPKPKPRQLSPPEEPKAIPVLDEPELIELQLVLPEGFVVRGGFAAELLNAFHNLAHSLSFELLGLPEGIIVQLCCSTTDRGSILESLRSYFPEVKIRQRQSLLESEWFSATRYGTLIDFGLCDSFFRQLKCGPHLDTDPLIGVIGALDTLMSGELGLVQVLFRPALAPWGNDLWQFAASTKEASDVLSLITDKTSGPLQACVIRVVALADDPETSFERARSIGNALLAAARSDQNTLLPLDNDGYKDEVHAEDVLRRQTHRSGMLLSLPELLSLVHLPTASVRASRMTRQSQRTKAAPDFTGTGSLLLGTNEHDGEERQVFLRNEQRLRHTYLIGASGTGKSTLLLNMVLQDITRGAGVAVLDPHGDLIEDILARLPAERSSDVILLDPSDAEFPVGFNVLSAHSDLEQTLLSSDLVGVFRRLSTSWGDQMTAVFGNAILAFLESSEGGTLLDLRHFLVDSEFRKQFLVTVSDPEVLFFWQREFPLLKGLP